MGDVTRIDRQRAIVLDRHGQRLTHLATEDTCLRDEWMHGIPGGRSWISKVSAFHARHPGCVVVDDRRMPIDDLSHWPICGGGHVIGDIVVTVTCDGTHTARALVGREELPDLQVLSPLDLDHRFVLEDGSVLAWEAGDNGWFAREPRAPGALRARPPMAGEPVEDWRPSAFALGMRGLDVMTDALDRVDAAWGPPDATTADHRPFAELAMHGAALRADRVWTRESPGYMALAPDALEAAAGWLATALADGRVHDGPWPDSRHAIAARVGSTVTGTLRTRFTTAAPVP